MLEEIKGVGPKTIAYLNKLNINSISDILTYYPFRYNYYHPTNLSNANDDKIIVITGIVESQPKIAYIRKNFNRLSFNFNTGNEVTSVTIFNRAFVKNHLSIGKTISLIGKYNRLKNAFIANDIRLKPIIKDEIEPVYHLISGLKKSNLRSIISNALTKNIYLPSPIPEYLDYKYKFIDKLSAVKKIHLPNSMTDIKQARLRLIYEEFFEFMLKINYLKKQKSQIESVCKVYDTDVISGFINQLPFKLTTDQMSAIEDIKKDFVSKKRMNRLLIGDVGCGKTIVAFIALYINYLAGYQGIMMAPTEILAFQHFNNSKKTFTNTNLKIAILTSSSKKREREEILEKLAQGEIDILIGTHAVLNENIKTRRLGLVITDEQHRFGVKQRHNLQTKGEEVDVLYLSATPIPRTLALTIYGDMDISQIKMKPTNNQITTHLLKEKDIKHALELMLAEIKAGHQAYVIAPLALESEDSELENVKTLYQKLDQAYNHKVPIAFLHGKLKSKEKDQIMQDFKDNKTKILVSTTVIEVGIDVKNATMMVIFNAERFGLATLHQLRGRVGRNEIPSQCIIISDYETERLKVLAESNDGFYISEKDFELRGTGDLFGVKQSGDMSFKIANLKTDFKILMQCKKDSEEFLNKNLVHLDEFPTQKQIIDSVRFID